MGDGGSGRIERREGPPYQGYELGVTCPRVVVAFIERYGHAPSEVIRQGSVWLAGPVLAVDTERAALALRARLSEAVT